MAPIMTGTTLKFYIFNNGLISARGWSGSDQRAFHWSQFFKKVGHQVTLSIPKLGVARYQRLGFKLIITDKSGPKQTGLLTIYLSRVFKTLKLVKHWPVLQERAVIYAASDLIVDSLPALWLKRKNPRTDLIVGVHLLAPNPFLSRICPGIRLNARAIYFYLSQQLILFWLRRRADLVLVSNSLDRQKLIKRGFSAKQVLVTWGGVDRQRLPSRPPAKKYAAAWVGRLHPQKGVNDLFSVWRQVMTERPEAKLVIIGESKLKEFFEKQTYAQQLRANLVFTGWLAGRKLFQTLSSARLFIFPSYHESFALAVAEAMACGLPVIAYNLPVYRRIWTQGMVRLPIGQANRLSQSVLNLLKNSTKRKRLAQAAKKQSQKFNWEKPAQKIISRLIN